MNNTHILLLEDKPDDSALIELELERTGLNLQYIHVRNEAEYLQHLTADIDLILSDYSLPRFNALTALDYLQKTGLDIPFIIVSGMINEDFAVECMKRGAADYLLKDRLTRLGQAIEQALLQKKLRQRTRALEQSEREQREFSLALNDTIRALNGTLELDEVMNLILENAGRVVPHDTSSIMLLEGETVQMRYWRGYPESFNTTLASIQFSVNHPLLHKTLETGTPRLVLDTLQEPDWTILPGLEWIRSSLSVPIQIRNMAIGFLNLDSTVANAFTETHAKWLQAFASEAALAIEKAQLYTRTRDDAARLDMLNRATSLLFTPFTLKDLKTVGFEIVQAVVNEFEFVDCGVLVLDEASAEIIRLARTGSYEVRPESLLQANGPGLVPEALRTRQTIYASDVVADSRYLPNTRRTRSELVIPLISGEHIVGALDFQSPYLNAFSERDQTLLEALAVRVATMIENMQLYERVRYYADELEERVEERTRALELEKERVEAILDGTNDAIVLLRGEIVEQVNPAYCKMYGYTKDEVIGRSAENFCAEQCFRELRELLEALHHERVPQRKDLVAERRDGTHFDVEVTVSLVSRDDDSLAVCSVRDISDRKRAEDGLRASLAREQELTELKSRFIAIVSHEFRNPLSVIQMSASTLQNYYDRLKENERERHFEKIDSQVRHMTSLLEDVLAIEGEEAQRGKLRRVEANLINLCWEVVEGFQNLNGENRQIIYDYPDSGLEKVLIDPKSIRQLVTNLVSNALKYSQGDVYLELTRVDDRIELSVRDQGIGIPEEDQQQLFQPFHRARNTSGIPGTGLGLLVAKNAVELHEGTIHLESKVGVGTTVTVTLPAVKEE